MSRTGVSHAGASTTSHRQTSMELQAADAYCRYLANRHYENFSVASLILPAALRLHLARIYAFCRTTDDLGDESGDGALARLALWREQVVQCFDMAAEPIHPVLLALSRTIAECALPRQPFLDLIAANVQDQTVAQYETWDELKSYCMLSAAPVGRMVLRAFGVQAPRAEVLSDDVCIGLQLANFAQDVAVDRAKGRMYLPQTDLRTRGLEGAVRTTCERAERLLTSGRELEEMVPARLRIQLALYRLGGMAILAEIARVGWRTDRQRPQVSRLAKARLIARALLESRRRSGYVPGQGAAERRRARYLSRR
jgi:squalene synthase HpnC